MTCLNPTTKAKIIAQIEKIDASILIAETAYDEALENIGVESYTFDSGQGRQSTKNRNPDTILKQIDRLEARRRSLLQRLQGTGVVSINVNRRPGRRYYN